MPIIAGILLIVEAGFKLLLLIGVIGASIFAIFPATSFPVNTVALVPIVMVPLIAWIGFTLTGGIFALQRKRWGLAPLRAKRSSLQLSWKKLDMTPCPVTGNPRRRPLIIPG